MIRRRRCPDRNPPNRAASDLISDVYAHLDELGGVAMTDLNHRDETTRHFTRLADLYGIEVRTHENEVCRRSDMRAIQRPQRRQPAHPTPSPNRGWRPPPISSPAGDR